MKSYLAEREQTNKQTNQPPILYVNHALIECVRKTKAFCDLHYLGTLEQTPIRKATRKRNDNDNDNDLPKPPAITIINNSQQVSIEINNEYCKIIHSSTIMQQR
jgi:hypothetical protein